MRRPLLRELVHELEGDTRLASAAGVAHGLLERLDHDDPLDDDSFAAEVDRVSALALDPVLPVAAA